jgi:hypothetical protein
MRLAGACRVASGVPLARGTRFCQPIATFKVVSKRLPIFGFAGFVALAVVLKAEVGL